MKNNRDMKIKNKKYKFEYPTIQVYTFMTIELKREFIELLKIISLMKSIRVGMIQVSRGVRGPKEAPLF